MREVGRIIIEAIRGRDDEAVQRRLAARGGGHRGPLPRPGPARRVTERVARSPRPVTFIEGADQSLGPIVAVFVVGGARLARC